MPRGVPGSGIGQKGHAQPAGVGRKMANLLKQAGQSDLDELDQSIAEVEAQMRGLRALRECVAERVLNAPANAKPIKPSAKNDALADDLLIKIARFIRFQGPTTRVVIARQHNLEAEQVDAILDCSEWFEKESKLWKLTAEGDAALERAKA